MSRFQDRPSPAYLAAVAALRALSEDEAMRAAAEVVAPGRRELAFPRAHVLRDDPAGTPMMEAPDDRHGDAVPPMWCRIRTVLGRYPRWELASLRGVCPHTHDAKPLSGVRTPSGRYARSLPALLGGAHPMNHSTTRREHEGALVRADEVVT